MVCFQALSIEVDISKVVTRAFYPEPNDSLTVAEIIIEDADIEAACNHIPPAIVNDYLRRLYQKLDPLVRNYLLDEKLRNDIKNTVSICCELLVGCTQEEGVARIDAALCLAQDRAHKALQELSIKPSSLSTNEYNMLYRHHTYVLAKVLTVFSIFYAAAEDTSLPATTALRKKLRKQI